MSTRQRVFLILGTMFVWGSLNAEFGYLERGCGCKSQDKPDILSTPLTLFYADTFCGGYVAKGTSIRNTWSGSIVIDSIPAGATVRKAFLYWMILNPTFAGNSGNFNGNPIVGDFVGSEEDPCWAVDSSYAFRKDVTSWVPGNGTYSVSFTGGSYGEGASLVVLYETSAKPEQVFLIYDGNVALPLVFIEYNWIMQGFIADNPVTEATITYIIADGQGVGLIDSMFYNGSLLDPNCTQGFDGPYWDTRTYDVTGLTPGGSTQANCRYSEVAWQDCINLEVCVLAVSKGTCPAGVEEVSKSNPSWQVEIYPNPFSAKAVIMVQSLGVSEGQRISLKIYDLGGRCVETLVTGEKEPGYYEVNWDPKGLQAGIYFAKFSAGDYKETKKLILMK